MKAGNEAMTVLAVVFALVAITALLVRGCTAQFEGARKLGRCQVRCELLGKHAELIQWECFCQTSGHWP